MLPGICSRRTILGNHCSKFIASPYARAGVLENNPVNIDMWAASRIVGLEYIVNVVINSKHEIIAAFAGEPEETHKRGCDFLNRYCKCSAARTDIVITTNGGYPLDQNLYQCVKGMTAAEACCAEDGVIIMAGACDDGSGGESFYKTVKNCVSPQILLKETGEISMEDTQPDQWEYQILARILSQFTVIFIARPKAKQMIENMKMIYASSVDEAVQMALRMKGAHARFTVIPDGISVIVNGGG